MTAFRCTAKLLKALKMTPVSAPEQSTNRLGDWSANLVRYARKPFVIAVAEHSRVAIIVPAAPYATLRERFKEELLCLFNDLEIPESQIEAEFAAMAPLQIARSNSRSVLASINQYHQVVSSLLTDEEPWSTVDLMRRLAEDISKPNSYEAAGDVARARFSLEPIIGPARRREMTKLFAQIAREHQR